MSKYSMTGKRNPATIYTYKCNQCGSKMFIAKKKNNPSHNDQYMFCYKCKTTTQFSEIESH